MDAVDDARTQRSRRSSRAVASGMLVALVAGVLIAGGLLVALYVALNYIPNTQTLTINAPVCGTWNGIAWPNVGSGGLKAVSAVAPDNVWAVGDQGKSSGSYRPLIRHWDGKNWSNVATPSLGGADMRFLALAALAADDIWAVGSGADQTLTAHWDGRDWTVVASPNVGPDNNYLYGVAAASKDDVWAVGAYYPSGWARTLALHWDGKAWSIVPTPNVAPDLNELRAVAVVSADDVWAVGSAGNQTLVLHWDGASWRVVPAPSHNGIAPIALYDLAAIGANDIWAVGSYNRDFGSGDWVEHHTALHWDGQRWVEEFLPNPPSSLRAEMRGIAPIAANDIWAVGEYGDGNDRAIVTHWDGVRWSLVIAPDVMAENRFVDLAVVPGGGLWAVGSSDHLEDGPDYALAAHFGRCPLAAPP
jgi:hypothetical protein